MNRHLSTLGATALFLTLLAANPTPPTTGQRNPIPTQSQVQYCKAIAMPPAIGVWQDIVSGFNAACKSLNDALNSLIDNRGYEAGKVKVTRADALKDYLNNSLTCTGGCAWSVTNIGGNEKMQLSSGAATGASAAEPFVTIGNTAGLSAERALTGSSTITVTDGGANSTATLATVALTGDVTTSGVVSTIGADKVLESMLKVVDAAVDEECLTYEVTTGDFEWQACGASAAEPFVTIGNTAGLSAERALAVTAPITLADGGANGSVTIACPTCLTSAFYQTVEDEGIALTQRTNLNFTGAGVSCADSGGKTVCTIAAGAGSSWDITGDSGSDTVNSGDNVTLAGGTNGIDTPLTVSGGNPTVTFNFDPTEVNTVTWWNGTNRTWTFDNGNATKPSISTDGAVAFQLTQKLTVQDTQVTPTTQLALNSSGTISTGGSSIPDLTLQAGGTNNVVLSGNNNTCTVGGPAGTGMSCTDATTDMYVVTFSQNCITTVPVLNLSVQRKAANDYAVRYTGSATQRYFDCLAPLDTRTTSGKGWKLTSVDVVYQITTTNLTAHSATLAEVCYANNTANAVTSKAITVTLATATQANPYVTNASVDTPAFENTQNCDYNLELAVTPQTTSLFDFYRLIWRYSQLNSGV